MLFVCLLFVFLQNDSREEQTVGVIAGAVSCLRTFLYSDCGPFIHYVMLHVNHTVKSMSGDIREFSVQHCMDM